MPKFMFAYHGGGMPETEEAQQAAYAAWGAWLGAHQADFVDSGAPVGYSYTVSEGGITKDGGSNPLSGYGIVQAVDYDAACEIAKGCPIVADGGSVEVCQIMEM